MANDKTQCNDVDCNIEHTCLKSAIESFCRFKYVWAKTEKSTTFNFLLKSHAIFINF